MPKGKRGKYKTQAKRKKAAQTIQAAYRNRRDFRKNLQPFVETKSFQSMLGAPVHISSVNKFTVITPDPFLYQVQGIKDYQMVGDSIYGRYLTTKLEISFPQPPNLRRAPQPLWVYQLWVNAPRNLTPFTTPMRDTETAALLEAHIESHCQEFYNTKDDVIEFHEKMKNIKVIGRQKIVPKRTEQIAVPANRSAYGGDTTGVTVEYGVVSPIYTTWSWPIKRKLHYEESTHLGRSGPHGDAYTHYMNTPPDGMGYPALVIFNPFAGEPHPNEPGNPGDNFEPLIRHNTKIWFGDQ